VFICGGGEGALVKRSFFATPAIGNWGLSVAHRNVPRGGSLILPGGMSGEGKTVTAGDKGFMLGTVIEGLFGGEV